MAVEMPISVIATLVTGLPTRPRVLRESTRLLCRAQKVRPGSAAELSQQAGGHRAALGGRVGVLGNSAITFGVRRRQECEKHK